MKQNALPLATGYGYALDVFPTMNAPGTEPNFARIRGLWAHSANRPAYQFTGATPRLDLAAAQSCVGRRYIEHTAAIWHVKEAANSVSAACCATTPEARDAALTRARAIGDSLAVGLVAIGLMILDATNALYQPPTERTEPCPETSTDKTP
jgi:hypothetical protein